MATSPVSAATVSLAWDPAAEATGYNIYYGTNSPDYNAVVNAGSSTTASISNLLPGVTYYFAATAYNLVGLESEFSQEINYTPPNQQPTLNAIPNLTVTQDSAAHTVPLTGISSGAPDEVQTLSLVAFASPAGLLASLNVDYTSPGSAGTLTFAPTPGAYGTSTITLMVDDGGPVNNTVIRTFTVTVVPLNYPPTLDNLTDITLDENAGPQMIQLTGISSGGDSTAQPLSLTATSSNPRLVPTPSINYSGTGTLGSLLFTPAANSYGQATISVLVNDGQPTNNFITRQCIVRVNQIYNGSTNTSPSTQWILWWQRTDGVTAQWQMDGTNAQKQTRLNALPASSGWRMAAMGDFGGVTRCDLVWHHSNGWVALWLLDGTNVTRQTRIGAGPSGPGWRLAAAADLDQDGSTDLIWHSTNGIAAVWLMNGTNVTAQMRLATPIAPAGWRIAAAPDIDLDGHPDILWQQPDGHVTAWLMNGTNYVRQVAVNAPPAGQSWRLAGTADLWASGNSDLLWQHDSGTLGYWRMDGINRVGTGRLNPGQAAPSWWVSGPR